MANIKVVYTVKKFIEILLHIVFDCKTRYMNVLPYNCGFRHQDGSYSFDCWNLVKSIFWGWTDGFNVGSYCFAKDKNGMGDWNGKQILDKCSAVSKNFSNIGKGEYLLTGMEDHAGIYIGTYTWQGYEFNTIECSPQTDVMLGGVMLTYTDEKGRRYNHKGGTQAGSWAYHGKLPWIDYEDEVPVVEVKVENKEGKSIVTLSGNIKAVVK